MHSPFPAFLMMLREILQPGQLGSLLLPLALHLPPAVVEWNSSARWGMRTCSTRRLISLYEFFLNWVIPSQCSETLDVGVVTTTYYLLYCVVNFIWYLNGISKNLASKGISQGYREIVTGLVWKNKGK